MPAPKGPPSTAKVSPKRPTASQTAKKLGSLSSFQSRLHFPPAPVASPRAPTNGSASSSAVKAEEDRKRMPPPSVGTQRYSRPLSLGGEQGKGKGKAPADQVEVVEVLSDEDEDVLARDTKHAGASRNAADMWTDRYLPDTETELAPGKQRIQKVKAWLHEALYGVPPEQTAAMAALPQTSRDKVRKYRRILLLTGPAGTGKTTTVRVLARELGIELVEYGEGVEEYTLGGGFDRESSTSKLSTFLSRHAYSPLSLQSRPAAPSSTPPSSSKRPEARPRVILLTALPNLTHLPTRETFHNQLLSFCKTFTGTSCPMVIVHSDAGSGGRAEESWMERDRGGREGAMEVVGKGVKDGPWCQEIDFIALAPTFVSRALRRVLELAVPRPTDRPPNSAIQLIALSCNGDLRSAINSLEMLCTSRSAEDGGKAGKKRKAKKGEEDDGVKRAKGSGKGSRGGRGAKLDVNDELRAVLDAVTRREQSLGLFHALGKVFYNKRLGDPGEDDADQEELNAVRSLPQTDPLPLHLTEFERRTPLLQMEAFIPTIPLDASSFSLWIHQSLPSFCTDVEQVSSALDDLCRADGMRSDDDVWQAGAQAISYALHLSVRGAQMALPSPVPRNHQKIIKPQFFASYRSERDNTALVDIAAGYIAKRGVAASDALVEGNVEDARDVAPWGGVLGKGVLTTEVLPMMAKMQGMTSRPLLPARVKALALPPYVVVRGMATDELTAKDQLDEEVYDRSGEGEEAVGAGGGWDEEDGGVEEQGEEDKGWLAEDDIQDFD